MVPNWPIFKTLSTLRGAKVAPHGLKMGSFDLFVHPNSPKVPLEKHIVDLLLTDCWSQTSPFSRHFGHLGWPKWLAMGPKWAHFTCLGTPNGLGSFLGKHIFDPLLTLSLLQNNPFSRHFVTFGGAKMACNGLKRRSFHLFMHPKWSIIFGKTYFDPEQGKIHF